MSFAEQMNRLHLSESQQRFLVRLEQVVESYFAVDVRRIVHTRDVAGYALDLLLYIDADPLITIAATWLHDIGIPEAERKYGSCRGKLQEQEGPPIARMLLADIGAEEEFSNRVCAMVGLHHTPAGLDTPEFRILWDADALVNLAKSLAGKQPHEIEVILQRALVTEAGHRIGTALYMTGLG